MRSDAKPREFKHLGRLIEYVERVCTSMNYSTLCVAKDGVSRGGWMTGFNEGLRGVPRQLVQRVDGLVATLAYLDAMRAPA